MLDLLVSEALVVDGSGSPPFVGSVGVQGDTVAWVGRGGEPEPPAARVVHGAGLTLAPGFVDVHNHSDLSPLVLPTFDSYIRQGVTTVVVGNCGFSPWPTAGFREAISLAYGDPAAFDVPEWASYGDYLDALSGARPAVNIATLVGHGTIRQEVLGLELRPPDAAELERMRAFVREAMQDGAFGLSTGLIYVPGMFARTDEVVALAEEAAAAGGLYASHIRGEGEHLFRAVDEALEIGARAGLPVHVSHLKCESSLMWGRTGELLARLEGGKATGDQYPYEAWNSSLSSLLPPWAPVAELERFMRDPGTLERLRGAVEKGEEGFQSSVRGVGWDRIVVVGTADHRWNGMNIAAIANEMGFDPFAACLRLLMEDPGTSCIGHAMDEEDVRAILADPSVFVASDGSADAPNGPGGDLPVHPREYGTFPRALALARDHDLLPLEAVVRKMTSLPAERFGLAGRGYVAVGSSADLVLLDPLTVRDTATYENPHSFPEGIVSVIVNGVVSWEQGTAAARSGGVLRRG